MKGCLNIIVMVFLLGWLVVKCGSSSSPPAATSKNPMEAMIAAAEIEANKPENNTIESKKRWLQEEREIALQEGDLEAVKALDAMTPAPIPKPKEVVVNNRKTSSTPSDCASSKITGIKYNVIGSDIKIRKGPNESSDQIINQKATSILNRTEYIAIDYSTTVLEECTKNGWSWVRVVTPEWLQDSHKGWVMSKVLDKVLDKDKDIVSKHYTAPKSAVSITIKSYIDNNFGIPELQASWYKNIKDVTVLDDTVLVKTNLASYSEKISAICIAMSYYVFSKENSALGLQAIKIYSKNDTLLIHRNGIGGICYLH